MKRGSGERELGRYSPTSLMMQIDAGTIKQEYYRQPRSHTLIAGAYIAGLLMSGTLGFFIGRAIGDESGTWILSSIGLMIAYVVGVSVAGRIIRG